MQNVFRSLAPVFLVAGSSGLAAAEIDAAAPMLCAVTQTVACDSLGVCVRGPADAVNLPVFLKIDLDRMSVESARQGGERRTSRIEKANANESAISLVGFEPAGSWSASIDKVSGHMTVTTAEQGLGFMVFGSCLSIQAAGEAK